MRDVRMYGSRERTSVSAALAILEHRISPLVVERVGLDAAHGRVDAEAVVASVDVTTFTGGRAREASSHHASAAAVAQGHADFGVAIEVAARARGLGFAPIAKDRYDFFVRRARRDRLAVRALLEELERPATRAALCNRGLVA